MEDYSFMSMQRTLGLFQVNPVGLGCMALSHAYGTPPDKASATALLNEALELGYNHLDTAALYGFGANEELLGQALKGRRHQFVLASKCGIFKNAEGVREINGRPEVIKKTCEESLRRLQTEVIDLYYLHRWDKRVPIEDSVGTLGDLVHEGKIRSVGLSEVSADTLRKAHFTHPITALQNEYSLWTRNPEISALKACQQYGITFVAFSPVGRGYLTDDPPTPETLTETDIRKKMPRFTPEFFTKNQSIADQFAALAKRTGYSRAQLSLAWLLHQGDHVLAIPGTTNHQHLAENIAASDITLDTATLTELNALINHTTVHGKRYPDAVYPEIDSEEFSE